MNKGWVRLHRDIFDNFLYTERPFCRIAAFIDLILLANHDDNDIFFDGEILTVKRGQFVTSIRKLSDRWGWSKTKIFKFLNTLERQRMIQRKSDKKKTVLTLINYDKFQDMKDTERTLKGHRKSTESPLKNLNKNEKNEKNEKNDIYSDPMTLIWSSLTRHNIHDALIHEYTIKQYFEKLGSEKMIKCIEKSSGKNASYLLKVCETVMNEPPKPPKPEKPFVPKATRKKPKLEMTEPEQRVLSDQERRELEELLSKFE